MHIETPLRASGNNCTTTKSERRQTTAKLVLGHLIEITRSMRNVCVHRPGESGETIRIEAVGEFPSVNMLATLALAISREAWESCRLPDLSEDVVTNALGEYNVRGQRYEG